MADDLFSTTGIPAALYAADRSALASGTALKRVFAPTYTMIHSLQARVLPQLMEIIEVLGQLSGVATDSMELTWGNPLDRLDTQTVLPDIGR